MRMTPIVLVGLSILTGSTTQAHCAEPPADKKVFEPVTWRILNSTKAATIFEAGVQFRLKDGETKEIPISAVSVAPNETFEFILEGKCIQMIRGMICFRDKSGKTFPNQYKTVNSTDKNNCIQTKQTMELTQKLNMITK